MEVGVNYPWFDYGWDFGLAPPGWRGGQADPRWYAEIDATEVWTWRGLVTYYTVFVIDLASRRVRILGSTPHPDELFMGQVARTLTMADEGLLRAHRVLICDRDAKWSEAVRWLLRDSGIRIVQTPWRPPNLNTHAERFVRSIKHECLDRIMPLGEQHFQQSVSEYVAHYHYERNHQGLGNALIDGIVPNRRDGRVRRRPPLGGLLSYYERAA